MTPWDTVAESALSPTGQQARAEYVEQRKKQRPLLG